MGKFRAKTIQGVEYVMDHLNDFTFGVGEHTVMAVFSCHCFTEEYQEGARPDLVYSHRGEKRLFSVERHALSQQLPSLIGSMGNRSVYHTRKGSFFYVKTEEGKPYAVFFRAHKANASDYHVIINVESAYTKPNITLYAAPVKFPTVISFTAQGKTPPTGPPVQIKRG